MAADREPLFGEEFFTTLVHHFYEGVAADAVLRPLYPPDLQPAEERLALFLLQYFGDDRRYEALRGEPMLRMRHLPFKIDREARDSWVACMERALQSTLAEGFDIAEEDLSAVRTYFDTTATFLMNVGLSISGS
jgi:truncated hemoglobin YjbI